MTLRFINSPSPNHNERKHPLDMLVLHYTGMIDGPTALARMRDPASEVSAHYMVEEGGGVHLLVPEEARAWHAGRSQWQGDEDLNSRSIGVEIVNGGHDYGLPPFPDAQIEAVIELCQAIIQRWNIPQTRIVAHSDIAADRKDDPGERFPWRRLSEAGVGLWPADGQSAPAVCDLAEVFARIGYAPATNPDELKALIRAFQRRWRPEHVSGEADEETVQLTAAVAECYGSSGRSG